MKGGLRPLFGTWAAVARGLGFLVLLVAGSAALGAVIAWPLWYFATSARSLYTAVALALAAAGIVYLLVRAAIRRRNVPQDVPGPRRTALSTVLGVLQVLVFLGGIYLAAVLVVHRIWLFAIPLAVVWLGLLVLLGLARRAARDRRRAVA